MDSQVDQVHVSVVLPIHNEEEAISGVLDELIAVLSDHLSSESWTIVLSEDGSRDQTRLVLERYVATYPSNLTLLPESAERLGYSRAVVRGLREVSKGLVCTMDSDGQCDPRDLVAAWSRVSEGHRICVGYRSPRVDPLLRRMYSKLFKFVFQLLFSLRLRDPSCPVMSAAASDIVSMNLEPVRLNFGFWWEFQARIQSLGLDVVEIPIRHRIREDGATRVYHVTKLPRIAATHLIGLIKLKSDLKR